MGRDKKQIKKKNGASREEAECRDTKVPRLLYNSRRVGGYFAFPAAETRHGRKQQECGEKRKKEKNTPHEGMREREKKNGKLAQPQGSFAAKQRCAEEKPTHKSVGGRFGVCGRQQ